MKQADIGSSRDGSVAGGEAERPEMSLSARLQAENEARRHAEAALARSEARYRALCAAIPDALLRVDRDGTYLDFSPPKDAAPDPPLPDAGGLVGRNIADVLPPDAAAQALNCVCQTLDSGQAQVWNCRLLPAGDALPAGAWHDYQARIAAYSSDEVLAIVRDASEHKQAEEAARRSQELHFSLLHDFPALIWRADLNGRCDYFNQTWLDFRGRTLAQEIGEGWTKGVHPEDLDFCLKTYREAFAARRPFDMEYRLRRHDGAYRWVIDCGRPFDDLNGQFAGYIGSCYDITERKQAAQALCASEELLRSVVEQAADAFFLVEDVAGRLVDVNQRACQSLGYSREELLQLSAFDIEMTVSPDHLAVLCRELTPGSPVTFEGVHRRKDGTTFPVEMSVSLIEVGGRTMMLGLARDISERKQVEEERHRSEALLREAQRLAHLGSWEWEFDSGKVTWSDEIYRICGLQKEEFRPNFEPFVARIHPDDVAATTLIVERAIEDWQGFSCDCRLIHPNGEVRFIHTQADVVSGDNGKRIRMFGTAQDVTELRMAQEALRESEERFRAFMSNSPVMAFMKDEAGHFIYINEPMERVFGISAATIATRPSYDWMPAAAAEVSRRHDAATLASGQVSEVLETVPGIDGQPRHWLVLKFPIAAPNRQRYIGGMAVDVTERIDAEQSLQHTRDQLRAVLDAVPGGVSWIDADLHYIGVNEHLAALFDLPPEAFVGQPIGFLHSSSEFNDFVCQFFAASDLAASRELVMDIAGNTHTYLMMAQKYRGGEAAVFVGVDVTESKQVEARLRHGAYHDTLTDLPNRNLFLDRLRRVLIQVQRRPDHLFAVLFLDFDRFKVVNDSLGHDVGDQLLIQVARRLETCLRPGDTIARLGGDEFVILLEEIHHASEATRVAERVQKAMALPFDLGGHQWFTAASIGIALGTNSYHQAEDVMRDADTAMYRAKAQGGGRYEIFDTAMHAEAMRRLQLETDLRYALERRELCVHYQPIISMKTGGIVALEALVRWQHPQRGLLLPLEFIPLAEETGLVVPLDRWVLAEACRQMQLWRELPGVESLVISVNLSGRHFSHPDMAQQVGMTLSGSGLPPQRLKLEITESVLLDSPETAAAALANLHGSGVSLSMDDFGTGYSSLGNLYQFSLDTLKVDRSFVARLTRGGKDAEIVRAIVTLAHNMGLDAVAEGVETTEQLEHLRALGCDYVQGFLFSKPVDAPTISRLLAQEIEETPDEGK